MRKTIGYTLIGIGGVTLITCLFLPITGFVPLVLAASLLAIGIGGGMRK